MAEYKYIEASQDGDVSIIVVVDPDIQQRLIIHELGDELIDFVDKQKPNKLLISFERVTFCSSEVIGGLIRARRRV